MAGHGDSLSHGRFLSDGTAARRRGAQKAIHSSPPIISVCARTACVPACLGILDNSFLLLF
jgi:hypothetical protein